MMDLRPYKTLPVWYQQSLPDAFTRAHRTQAGTWAQLTILKGSLTLEFLDDDGQVQASHLLDAGHQAPVIAPQHWHRIAQVSADVQCQLQFLCTAEDYFNKKHGLTRTHSEVLEAVNVYGLEPGLTLDAGCGSGRNTLFLAAKGFDVDAWDINQPRLDNLNTLAKEEGLSERIRTRWVDFDAQLPKANAPGTDAQSRYNFILSTVVLMFLQPQSALNLVAYMQQATRAGGHNLIVAAMNTEDQPCPAGLFPFTFAANQLRKLYAGWDLRKYNEDLGHLHRTDAQGQPIALRFATMLARKPST